MSRWLGNGDENSGQVQQQLYELYTVVVHQGNGSVFIIFRAGYTWLTGL